ncbi:DUF6430 domain-containing protein [Desulfovibrio sp. JY]|nr:DUF6430 domain-containing protein [Desulfovibrio sp. JY]
MKYFFNTILSKTYWQYLLLSRTGIELILSIFGGLYLFVEALDFFKIYSRDKYAPYAFIIILLTSIIGSILLRRPINSISVQIPNLDIIIEVKIANLFDSCGAIMISTNTKFEADVAGGKIDPHSLQGQFTAMYFTGNQTGLIEKINSALKKFNSPAPFPMGTTIPINTHGRTFYFTAMSSLNAQGNAETTIDDLILSLEGLWQYIKDAGDLQELAIPVIGTGRGRLKQSRKKVIAIIAESFMKASEQKKFTDKLTIVIWPKDAHNFGVNLYDIKDNLRQILYS